MTVSSLQVCCDGPPRATVGNWSSTNPGFTMRTGRGACVTLHTFTFNRFPNMLLSPSPFSSRWVGCPWGRLLLTPSPFGRNLTDAETAHVDRGMINM
ncbi:hypothetical protein [Reticulibacter mediterranei]|uniref:hypothetical protein n=1 Tax=Reticulibacter mediterranei TaxID=2778369 RepID=UPI001C68D4DC|nr:hypothetical protein [Reticulibacter mediterranei]